MSRTCRFLIAALFVVGFWASTETTASASVRGCRSDRSGSGWLLRGTSRNLGTTRSLPPGGRCGTDRGRRAWSERGPACHCGADGGSRQTRCRGRSPGSGRRPARGHGSPGPSSRPRRSRSPDRSSRLRRSFPSRSQATTPRSRSLSDSEPLGLRFNPGWRSPNRSRQHHCCPSRPHVLLE